MKALTTACLLLPLFIGCIPLDYNGTRQMYLDHSNIKHDILISGQPQRKFQSIWGPPTKTYSRRFDVGAHDSFTVTPFGGGGSFQAKGGETYDLWYYKEKKVTLFFDKGELVYWDWSEQPPDTTIFQTDKVN